MLDNKYDIPVDVFYQKLGYKFKNKKILKQALTHPSYRSMDRKILDYERLEFLGDSILGCIISTILFEKYPEKDEGYLSKSFSSLVSRESCYIIAKKIDLGKYLLLSAGEEKNQGRSLKTNLANAMEALIAAIYLDSNKKLKDVTNVVVMLWSDLINGKRLQDAKTRLQEWSQMRTGSLPEYKLLKSDGPDHVKSFLTEVVIQNLPAHKGKGPTKKDSEKQAAKYMLDYIKSISKSKDSLY